MIEFTVKPDAGDEYEVTAEARDVLMWEKTTKGASLSSLRERLSMQDLYKLAYLASKRQGLFDGTQKEFEESVDIDFEKDAVGGEDDDEEEPDPTP